NYYYNFTLVQVEDNRGIIVEAYSYCGIKYTIDESAIQWAYLTSTTKKTYGTYLFELLPNGTLYWFEMPLKNSGVNSPPIPIPPVKQIRVFVGNNALHVYDYDVNGKVVVKRIVNQLLSSGSRFSIEWSAFVTNYSDPSNIGVVLQNVTVKVTKVNKVNYYSFLFLYNGGNVVSANGTSITKDMSILHTYNITVTYIKQGNKRNINAYFYVDDNQVQQLSLPINPGDKITIDSVGTGSYSTSSIYDLYIDNVNMVVNGQVTTEDFEDGVDNFFVNSYSLGDAGKEVVYYTFPKIFLVAYNNDSNSYLAKLSITSLPSSKVSANFWIRGASTSTSIKIRNSVIVVGETSEISLSSSSNSYLYLNVTAPLTATLPLEFHLDFVYRVPNSDGVTVTYPVVVRFG
ncbi:MAG: hypothetical protein ACP5HX_08990, partial [Thermoproteota archaeon]